MMIEQSELFTDLKRSIGSAENSLSLPPRCYRDEEVLALEIERIFKDRWISAGRSDRVSAPGDFDCLTPKTADMH